MKRIRIGFILLIIVMLIVSGCNSNSASTNESASEPKAVTEEKGAVETKEMTIEEIANLEGSERERLLVEGAKKEGKLTWYTTYIVDQAVRPVIEAFNEKYPFITVEYYRGNNSQILEKVLNEHRANRHQVDVIDASDLVLTLKQNGDILQKVQSPHLSQYPDEIKDPDQLWAAANLFYITIGYNTKLVPEGQVPKTYEDLLNPQWKGGMAWNSVGVFGGPGFVGNILKNYGEEKGMEYLEKLSQQKVINMDASARAVLDRSIAGEFPIALQIFSHHPLISAAQGAPVDWQPLDPVLLTPNVVLMAKHSPNPYSAMLFIDFLLNKEGGQKILSEANYIPAHPEVPIAYEELRPEVSKFEAAFMSPEQIGQDLQKWTEVFNKLFMK